MSTMPAAMIATVISDVSKHLSFMMNLNTRKAKRTMTKRTIQDNTLSMTFKCLGNHTIARFAFVNPLEPNQESLRG